MKSIIASAVLLTSIFNYAMAAQKKVNCRDAVVYGYATLGVEVKRDSFAMHSFDDFGYSSEQFNSLSPEIQNVIYSKIKPLDVVVEQTISDLNQQINQIKGTVYEYFYADELQAMRQARDLLRACENRG